jgi:hypothetical protein
MSRSFFNGTETELYNGANVFAARIVESPSTYGLTQAAADAFAALNTTFRQAYAVANAPATRCPTSVIAKNTAKDALKLLASQLAKVVSGTSTVSDAERSAMGLSVRSAASPMRSLGTPQRFKIHLQPAGDLTLTWKCNNPRGANGTLYAIYRQLNGEGEFTRLACIGKRTFTDSTVPAGSMSITYRVQAIRSTGAGECGFFIVNLGKPASAIQHATTSASINQLRMAA